ncbi:MAG: hypothetical protein K1X55_05090 [Chitinophagales bacterium]|nr:hypothetical protein [Chitinophagales bacterium]
MLNFLKLESLRKHQIALILALGGIFCLINILLFFSLTIDDAFISYRYAKIFIDHGIWNWNPNHHMVEAYTTFTHTILPVIPYALGFSIPIFMKLFSLLLLVLIIRRLTGIEDNLFRTIAIFVVLVNPLFYIHAFAGIETILFVYLIFDSSYMILYRFFDKNKTIFFFFLYQLLLPLTRPEGALFSMMNIAVLFFMVYTGRKSMKLKHFFLWLGGIAIIGIAYFAWRFQYFGKLFPNPFYFKTVIGSEQRASFDFLFNNIKPNLIYIFIGILCFLNLKDNRKYFFLLMLPTLIICIGLYIRSNLLMNYANRFEFQIMIAFNLLLLFHQKRRPLYLTAIFLLVFLVFSTHIRSNINLISYYPRVYMAHQKIGEALEPYKDKGYKLMVGDAGFTPFYADWNTVDYTGLANGDLAANFFTTDYFIQNKPDVIILNCSAPSADKYHRGYNMNVVYDYLRKNTGEYEQVAVNKWSHNHYLICFVRKQMEDFAPIKSVLSEIGKQSYAVNESYTINNPQFIKDIITQKYLKTQ